MSGLVFNQAEPTFKFPMPDGPFSDEVWVLQYHSNEERENENINKFIWWRVKTSKINPEGKTWPDLVENGTIGFVLPLASICCFLNGLIPLSWLNYNIDTYKIEIKKILL